MPADPEMFSPAFLAAIESLVLDARPASPREASAGTHLSRAVGASLDFRDFRPYAPGDDLRRIDWNVYRRTGGHLFVRRFDQPTTTAIHVLLDDSASMFAEVPAPRFAVAARATLAVVAAALRNNDPVRVDTFASAGPPRGAMSGRRRLPEAIARLSGLHAKIDGALADGVERVIAAGGSRGVAVVISDFFDNDGVDHLLAQLARLDHRLVCIQITHPSDADPTSIIGEDVELIDSEGGRSVAVTLSTSHVEAYQAAYVEYQSKLASFLRRRGALHVTLDASEPDFRHHLAAMFPNGVLRVGGGSAR